MNTPALLFNKKYILSCVLFLLAVSVTTPAAAGLKPKQDKLIRARTSTRPLAVNITPIKSQFAVDEKIRLRSQGNKPYYLYLFNVDPQTGQAIMILPNKLQPNNYYGQQGYVVPNRDVEFFSDREGQEQMIMVASSKALKVGLENYKSVGDFITGQSAKFEKSLGIRFNAPKQTNPDLVVKTFNIKISGKSQTVEPSFLNSLIGGQPATPVAVDNHASVAFVSTAYNEYTAGEQFNLIFGANQKGYVHLYAIDPFGAYDLLTVAAVDGKGIQTLKIQATAPYGRYSLVALFKTHKEADYKSLEDIVLNADKSLYVVKASKRALAMHSIYINPSAR